MGGHVKVPNPNMSNVFMAVAMDLPDDNSPYGSIHPRDKTTVADRLILGARAVAYGEKNVSFQGPVLSNCTLVRTDQMRFKVIVKFIEMDGNGIEVLDKYGFEV